MWSRAASSYGWSLAKCCTPRALHLAMRKYVDGVILWLVALFCAFPWVLGFVDGLSIFLTSSQFTTIPWTAEGGWRMGAALAWPFGYLMITMMFV